MLEERYHQDNIRQTLKLYWRSGYMLEERYHQDIIKISSR